MFRLPAWMFALGASAVLSLCACNPPQGTEAGQPDAGADAGFDAGTVAAPITSLTLIKKVVLTSTGEDGSARPEIAATDDRVFALYLAGITAGTERRFDLKVYDSQMNTVLAKRQLVSSHPAYGSPTDIRVARDGPVLFAAYETNKPQGAGSAGTFLWVAKYSLDDAFILLASTPTPLASSHPQVELAEGGEMLDDPAPLVGPNSVFVVTRLKYSINPGGKTVYRVRELAKDTLAQLGQRDLDFSSVADGRGRVTSLAFFGEQVLMAIATTTAPGEASDTNDDTACSDILLVRLSSDWTFDAQRDVFVVTAEPDDHENYISGLEVQGQSIFITYKQLFGSGMSRENRAWIKVLDSSFKAVVAEKVKSVAWPGSEIRPSLEVVPGRLLSGQSGNQIGPGGNAEVYLYDLH